MKILAEHLVLEILSNKLAPKDFPSDAHVIRKVLVLENVDVLEHRVSNIYLMEQPTTNGVRYINISEDKFNQMNYAMKAITDVEIDESEEVNTIEVQDEPQYFIRARSHEILKEGDVVKVCGYEDDYLLAEKVSDEVLVVDSERPDDDGNLLIRIYGKKEVKDIKVLPESLWDYDRSLCHSRKTIGLRVKNVKDNKVYFYDKMAYEGYGIEYFNGKIFKPHVKK